MDEKFFQPYSSKANKKICNNLGVASISSKMLELSHEGVLNHITTILEANVSLT